MTKEQFQVLMDYIDARIDEKMGNALGRDTLQEYIKVLTCRAKLEDLAVIGDDDD